MEFLVSYYLINSGKKKKAKINISDSEMSSYEDVLFIIQEIICANTMAPVLLEKIECHKMNLCADLVPSNIEYAIDRESKDIFDVFSELSSNDHRNNSRNSNKIPMIETDQDTLYLFEFNKNKTNQDPFSEFNLTAGQKTVIDNALKEYEVEDLIPVVEEIWRNESNPRKRTTQLKLYLNN